MSYLENKYFLIALTFVVYVAAQILQRRTGISFLNPILITIAVLICILMSAGVDYDTYAEGGEYIDFWLKPAVVALGVPLYHHLEACHTAENAGAYHYCRCQRRNASYRLGYFHGYRRSH